MNYRGVYFIIYFKVVYIENLIIKFKIILILIISLLLIL